jgi:hypothetical protein
MTNTINSTTSTTTTLTISQALRAIKRVKGQMAEFSRRASESVSHLSDKEPHFSFVETRAKMDGVREQLIVLESAVAEANAVTVIRVDGRRMTIASAIRRLQEVKAEIVWLGSLQLKEGVERVSDGFEWDDSSHRNSPKIREVIYVTALREPERVEQIDALKERFERINDAVETANHVTLIRPLDEADGA